MRAAPRVRRLMELCARANSAELTIGIPQYGVLRHFEHDGPGCIVDVTGNAFASKQTLSQLIDGLVENGLLSRSADSSDRRKVEVAITAEGRDSLLKFEAVQVGLLHRLFPAMADQLVHRRHCASSTFPIKTTKTPLTSPLGRSASNGSIKPRSDKQQNEHTPSTK